MNTCAHMFPTIPGSHPWFGAAISLAALLALAGGVPAGAVPPGQAYEPMAPVRCQARDTVEIRQRYIRASDSAVVAQGFCTVRIYDSFLESDAVAVVAMGQSKVWIHDSYVKGVRGALKSEGQSDIVLQRTRTTGGAVVEGHGNIEDLSGQVGPTEVQPGDARISVGLGGIELGSGGSKVSIGPGGISISEGDPTEGSDQAGDTAVRGPGGSVVVGAGGIRVRSGGSGIGDGAWRAAGPGLSTADAERLLVELGATAEGGQLHLRLAGDVLFDFDSTAIRADAARELAKVARIIRHGAVGVVTAVGHTDSAGSERHNQDLSERRARAVTDWLATKEGIPPPLLRASGAGESQPVAHNAHPDGSDDPAGRAKNRRVEIRFVAGDEVLAVIGGGARIPDLAAGEVPASCARICDAWPGLDELAAGCVVASLEQKGYRVLGTTGCVAIEETSACRLCWRVLDVSERDCAATSRACLGR